MAIFVPQVSIHAIYSCGQNVAWLACLEMLMERPVMQVIAHCWGEDVAPLMPPPDLIIGADVVYQQEHFDSLISTLQHLAAPHTLVYLAFKLRGELEDVESMSKDKMLRTFRVHQKIFAVHVLMALSNILLLRNKWYSIFDSNV